LPWRERTKRLGSRGSVSSCWLLCVLCFVLWGEQPFSYSTNDTYFVESWISNRPKWPTFAHF
jgi:hypothetical protein